MNFASLLTGFSLELGIARKGGRNYRGIPGLTRSLMISSAVWIQSNNVTDRRKGGRHRTTASLDKN